MIKNKLVNQNHFLLGTAGGLGNNLFMMAHAIAKSIESNQQFIIFKKHFANFDRYSKNIFRKFENYIDTEDSFGKNSISLPSGYFQSETYFKKYSELIKFLFNPNDEFLNKIAQVYPFVFNTKVTAIHVRRGDYLHYPKIHPVVSKEYVELAFTKVPNNQHVLIFSDDINWCKENLKIPNAIFVQGLLDYEEIWLMSLCDDFVIPNSTFSWWGAYLSRNSNKKVIAPETWFGPEGPYHLRDMYCEGWEILPTYYDNGIIRPK